MKHKIISSILLFLILILPAHAFALDKPNIEIAILSPDHVQEYPGAEKNVVAKITNHSNQAIEDMMIYITLADINKHWTVNLEDYSADKPVTIGTLNPNETKEVALPVRFVYTGNYVVYVTAMGTKQQWIYSSSSFPVEIMGNTKINPAIVQLVSIVEPLILLIGLIILILRKRSNAKES